uniref:Uncharacterized protein n=1 Tax=Arundo donax TaxID=35708 RepID=A0A0A9CD71_ARUDO
MEKLLHLVALVITIKTTGSLPYDSKAGK